MAEELFTEKRVFPRFPVSIPLCCFYGDTQVQIHGKTHDISAEGLGMVLDTKMPPGTELHLYLEMPDNRERIERNAQVVWIQEVDSGMYRMGLKLQTAPLKPIPLVLRTLNFQRKY